MIEIQTRQQVAVLEMTRGKVNAMNLEFCQALIKQLETVADDDALVAAVLIGNERVFSAGVDLVQLVEENDDYLVQYLDALDACFETVFRFPKPLVTAVSGHAIAGGCVLASAGDKRMIRPDARIGLPELRIGVPLPSRAIEIMRFAVSPAALRDMVNAGQTYQNQAAVDVGLIDEVVPADQLRSTAIAAAEGLTVVPPNVFAISKAQQRSPAVRNWQANEAAYGEEIRRVWRSPENRKVVEAYVRERLS